MQLVPLSTIPNQSLSFQVDSTIFDMTVRAANGIMAVSIDINSVTVIENLRAVASMRIIPAQYQEAGNFAFVTQNGALPYYDQFGITQSLIYISAAELAALRVPTPTLITAAFFNPIAALPLRFSPQGYAK